jgi:tetratricopeptide (TPR) repeat protein
MLSKLGSRDEAVREFDRILSGELGIGPTSDEWAEALLGRGRALGERGRADLREYVERYSARFDYRARVAEAGLLLARAAIREGDWPAALDVLARIDPLSDQAPEIRQEIRSLKGDVLLGQGRWDEAAIAYDQAYRADLTSDERLWCLLGRARAFLRLGRREDARRDYENGRALYENRREAFDRSLAMHGKDVWGTTLETIERELQ